MAGRPCRFLRQPGSWIGSPHLLFSGAPAIAVGSTWQIDPANPGRLVAGGAAPILLARATQSYGATMELI
jgi:DNA gyrase/topoisomerase IV subunit A